MKTYCVKCRKDTENIDPKMAKTKNVRLPMQLIKTHERARSKRIIE